MDDIKTVAVAGAGTMGSGIAIVAARAGFETYLFDTSEDTIARARKQTEGFFAKSVAKGKLTEEQVAEILGRMHGTSKVEDLASSDLVIEAVFEDLNVKHDLLGRLNDVCPEHTIFATNTSTLSISEIAGGSGRSDRVVGMHFCLPAQLMKLVEMSPGLNTSEETFKKAWAFCESLKQKPVRTQDTPGFILNYFLVPFNNDVIRLVESGVAEPADVDRAIKKGLGYPMGPCELLDLIGLDTQVRLCEAFYEVTKDPRAACPPLLKRMVAANRLGRKTGQGFYNYEQDAMFGG
ncbi:3-hydroxyacyl-CoA dehydrogenase family protein [Marinobacter sp. GN3S48]|uniref:3-hydroxyacyl-CoA dehydrogenase family protein n=1 Tax=Marinobacter sp. GN3S48 TaxID=3382302 RepID=UPI00387AAB71